MVDAMAEQIPQRTAPIDDQGGHRHDSVHGPGRNRELAGGLGSAKLRTLLLLVMRNATTETRLACFQQSQSCFNRNLDRARRAT